MINLTLVCNETDEMIRLTKLNSKKLLQFVVDNNRPNYVVTTLRIMCNNDVCSSSHIFSEFFQRYFRRR